MSRPLRIQYPGAVYDVMNRGRARQPAFVGRAGGDLARGEGEGTGERGAESRAVLGEALLRPDAA